MLPNLCCFCSTNLNPTILTEHEQEITFTITENNITSAFDVVYASTCYLKRRLLWDRLNIIQTTHPLPWSIIGDFNTVLRTHECRGSHSLARILMTEFAEWSDNLNLVHLPTKGAFFTWANNRGGAAYTEKRLHRVLCNQSWIDMCSNISVSTLNKTSSDHFPLLFEFHNTTNKFVFQFKFMRMWTMNEDCKKVVEDSWNIPIVGCPMYILAQKLKRLKVVLKDWNKNIFGDIHAKVNEVEDTLQSIQLQIDSIGPSDNLFNLQKQAQMKLNEALGMQEVYWKEKTRVNWHNDGDRNTKYFHILAKIKNTNKLITSIKVGEITLHEPNDIAEHITNYFKIFFLLTLFCRSIIWWKM